MRALTSRQCRRLVDRRAQEGMTKHQRSVLHPNQSCFLGRIKCAICEVDSVQRRVDDTELAGVLRAGDHQSRLRSLRQSLELLSERGAKPRRQWQRLRQ